MKEGEKTTDNLKKLGISPVESLGQHILVNKEAINTFVGRIEHGVNVIEIGPGPGNLTAKIADRAQKVVAIEIDQRFKPRLDAVQLNHPNIEVIYADAIALNFNKIIKANYKKNDWQIASSLPFHISEPFMQKIIDIPIESVVLIVGDQLARKMQIDNPNDLEFSRLTQTFFEINLISHLRKDSFYPQPRTEAVIVVLNPREKKEYERNPGLSILRNLFLTERRSPSIIKVIKDSESNWTDRPLMSKNESHRFKRRQTRQELRQMVQDLRFGYEKSDGKKILGVKKTGKLSLPNELLSKPFSRLDNQDIRTLALALKVSYGQY